MSPLLVFDMNLRDRGDHYADWSHHGDYTDDERNSYLHVTNWPGTELTTSGLECNVAEVSLPASAQDFSFDQSDGVIVVRDLPESFDMTMNVVLRFAVADWRASATTVATAITTVSHCRYNPVDSDLQM